MKGILADANIEGHLGQLVTLLEDPSRRELWEFLRVSAMSLSSVGLSRHTPDLALWQFCQDQEFVLLTANRNSKGLESLEATIRRLSTHESLPVLTLSDADRVLREREYAG